MDIIITDDGGTQHVYTDVPFEVGAAVAHALAGESPKTGHHSATGACMCSSLSQETTVSQTIARCKECGHTSHHTRTYCGALR